MEPQSQEQQKHHGRFSIFLLVKTAHNSYGVKNGDYLRYRRYCTRKVEKLRAAMSYKYGNRTKFLKKDITEDRPNDKKTLYIAMFNAERYWAAANEQKFAQSIKQEHKLRARFMAIKKFKRAYLWSQKLLKLCSSRTDGLTISEAEAYSFILEGSYYFERQEWKEAEAKLISAREIMSGLMVSIDSVGEKILQEKIDQIDQTIKFCHFKLSKGKEMPIAEIIEIRKIGDPSLSSLIQNLTEKRLNDLSLDSQEEIKFGQNRYPISNKKIIVQKGKIDSEIGNLQVIKQKSMKETGDEQLYEELLNFFGSIIVLIDDTIKMTDAHKDQLIKSNTQGEAQIARKVSLFFEEMKIELLIDRNHTIFKHSYLAGKGKKNAPQTLAKLLSNTIALYGRSVELQKEIHDGSSTSSYHEIVQRIDAKVFMVRTIRLMFVGQVYFNNDKVKEAYSLWGECQRCLASIKNSSLAEEIDLINLAQISETTQIGQLRCILHDYWNHEHPCQNLTEKVGQITINEENNQSSLTLLQLAQAPHKAAGLSLSEYSCLQAVELPGRMLPIPTRPIFYDIYESQVKYPGLENKLKKNEKVEWWKKLFGK